jgi:23S rRNA pseudouridine2604 synthase
MLEKFDLRAKRLKRIRVLNIGLGDLAPGEWRDLTAKEKTILLGRIQK